MVVDLLLLLIIAPILAQLAALALAALLYAIYAAAVLMIQLVIFVILELPVLIFRAAMTAAMIIALCVIPVVEMAIVINLAALVMANLATIILGAEMVAAGVIIGAVMVATAHFIGNIPTYLRSIYSAVAQAAINAAHFVASFFRTQAPEPVVATPISESERSTLPRADAHYVSSSPLNNHGHSETLTRRSVTFFNSPASIPSARPFYLDPDISLTF